MTIVIDANVTVALVIDPMRGPVVEQHLRKWTKAGDTLHAPSLLRYEVANALTRSVVANAITSEDAEKAWQRIAGMPITLHELQDGQAVIAIARQLSRQNAYDAAYIALAQELKTNVWTLDGPLARNATGAELPVQLIELAPSKTN